MKEFGHERGMVKLAGDWVLAADALRADFRRLRARCHELGLRFYCAENCLRRLSDSRCCCGVDGLRDFRPNRANLNSLVYGRRISYTRRMSQVDTAFCFKTLSQGTVCWHALKILSYRETMQTAATIPAFRRAMGLREVRP